MKINFIKGIYPSSPLLPENMLRFYIYFSKPMREGEALKHIQLVDTDNEEIPAVFLDTKEELWDSTMTRLTVLFDPGRVKTGLRAHNQWGRALIEGENYKLVIDKAWLDLHGNPLETSFEKHFTVSRAQASALSIEDWHITPPKM